MFFRQGTILIVMELQLQRDFRGVDAIQRYGSCTALNECRMTVFLLHIPQQVAKPRAGPKTVRQSAGPSLNAGETAAASAVASAVAIAEVSAVASAEPSASESGRAQRLHRGTSAVMKTSSRRRRATTAGR